MVMEQVWNILGISETKDENIIKNAYREKLVNVNPEDDPDGFKRLREAYETAVTWSNSEEREKDEIDLWVDRFNDIYVSMERRRDKKAYRELFEDDLVVSLDTADLVRDRLMVYLLDHYYLPSEIYRLIDSVFDIINSKEELLEKFQGDYLDYFEYMLSHEAMLDYSLFEYNGLDSGNVSYDEYINSFYKLRESFEHGDMEAVKREFSRCDDMDIYHPYMEVEKMKVANIEKNSEKALKYARKLLEEYSDNYYIRGVCGAVLFENGDYEDAMELFNRVLEENPDDYGAALYRTKYELMTGQLENAKEHVLELLENNSQDFSLIALMKEINMPLMKKLYEKYAASGKASDAIDYAWCVFQNEDYEDAQRFLESLEYTEEDEYEYVNLYGRCLYAAGKDKQALPYLIRWNRMIADASDDGSEKYQKKIRRKGFSYAVIGMALMNLEKYREALGYLCDAIDNEDYRDNRLSYMERKAVCHIKLGEVKEAVDMCDEILREDNRYFPAYVARQEAYYSMRNGQGVIDDYFAAIEIYAGYYKPYEIAARTYNKYRQYEDALKVINRAREENIDSDVLKFVELSAKRMLVSDAGKEQEVIEGLSSLCEKLHGTDETDIENKEEVFYETSLAFYDARKYNEALKYIDDALECDPEAVVYRWAKGDIYAAMGDNEKALKIYGSIADENPDSPDIFYDMGCVYKKMKRLDDATECFEKALSISPEHNRANFELARIYKNRYDVTYRKEYYVKALEAITRQIDTEEHPYFYHFRGNLLRDGGRLREAVKDLLVAVESNPQDVDYLNDIGYTYKVMGDYEKALTYFLKAIEVLKEDKTKLALPFNNIADVYKIRGEYGEALKYYRDCIDTIGPTVFTYSEMFETLLDIKDYKQAETIIAEMAGTGLFSSVVIESKYSRLYSLLDKMILGKLHRVTSTKGLKASDALKVGEAHLFGYKDYKLASKFFIYALKSEELDLQEGIYAQEKLIRCYYLSGSVDTSKSGAEELISFIEDKCGSVEDYIGYMPEEKYRKALIGRLMLYMGRKDEAKKYFEMMKCGQNCHMCGHRECFEIYLNYAWMYEAEAQYEDAMSMYLKVLKMEPGNEDALVGLRYVMKKKKKK